MGANESVCQWFDKCENVATKQVKHPTIGWVDCCDVHIEWLGCYGTSSIGLLVTRKVFDNLGRVRYTHNMSANESVCQWFAKCENVATKQVEHPTIGWVDCCDEHIEWLGEKPSPTQFVPPLVAREFGRIMAQNGI